MAVFCIKIEAEMYQEKKSAYFLYKIYILEEMIIFSGDLCSQFNEDILSVFCVEKLFRMGG